MADRRTSQVTALRRAIDCLPVHTRRAMLVGVENNTIVVGAYTTEDGVCPMLAAHRNGGRTNFVAFARAWDEYCFGDVRPRKRRPRLATATELTTLHSHIEASLLGGDGIDTLSGAVRDHRSLVSARERPEAGRVRPADPDHSREQSALQGGHWLRVMRSLDEYEQALAQLAQLDRLDIDIDLEVDVDVDLADVDRTGPGESATASARGSSAAVDAGMAALQN